MASRKKQLEGIALLSMYNDDDDEDMEEFLDQDEDHQQQHEEGELPSDQNDYIESNLPVNDMDELPYDSTMVADSTPVEVLARPPTPQVSVSSSPQQRVVKRNGRGGGRFMIVDYAHDEVAMSPEPDDGEFDEELQTATGAGQEKTPPGTVQVLTPNVHTTSLSSEHLQTSQVDELNNPDVQSEAAENEGTTNDPAEHDDPLDKFLPPPPKDKCPEDLQRKIDKFIALKKVGRSFNAEVRNRKDYRNPDFLQHAVRYQEVDEIGSCFSKDVFDPHGYDLSDFYIEIEADMRREKDRKEQELKKSPKVEFMSGGTQPGQVIPSSKFSLPIPVASGGLHSVDAFSRDGRQNKKSKWDKVDGDGRNSLPTGGQDSLATVATHAAMLSAANAGAGYSAFVQQKRREAEERRSSEKKLERRS
ncbi:transcriptional regulator family protein [Euphorbia peplus]|nr:transcriptional regulator family protein [Euphorbia peplus]